MKLEELKSMQPGEIIGRLCIENIIRDYADVHTVLKAYGEIYQEYPENSVEKFVSYIGNRYHNQIRP